VLRALDGDINRRYASADELAGGLRLGLMGEDVSLPPAGEGATTRVLGGETATRRLDETRATDYRPPSPSRRPAPRAAPAPPPPRAVPAPGRRGAFSRFARLILTAVVLVLIAAAVAVAVIVSTDKATGVHVTEVAGDSVHKVVEEFKELVKKNTE
jgi:hypothetical protein